MLICVDCECFSSVERENVQNEVAERAGGDGWKEIIGVRSIDSSLAVKVRGRR